MRPTQAMVDTFKQAWHFADENGRQGERVEAGLTAALSLLDQPVNTVAYPPTEFVSRIEREGIVIDVTVVVPNEAAYTDMGEITELVGMASSRLEIGIRQSRHNEVPF